MNNQQPPPPSNQPAASFLLWTLPEAVLYHIVEFVAPPTHRAGVVCHQWALLCRAAAAALLPQDKEVEDSLSLSFLLWDIILRQDYGVQDHEDEKLKRRGDRTTTTTTVERRACKRLRRSVLQRVQSAHQLIHDNTEIAFFYLSEMTNTAKKGGLSKAKLRALLEEYGPIRVNHVVSSGGLFLVELCRARHARQATILQCVKELVEQYGALVNGTTRESNSVHETALCVAAARGMPTVVQYLLQQGADPNATSSGRFRYSHSRKTLARQNETALGFCIAMRNAEALQAGLSKPTELQALDACIQLLQPVTRKTVPT